MLTPQNQSFFLKSPALIFLVVALSVFAAEASVMLLLHYLPRQSIPGEAVIDATLLVALISPALYFFLFRPMVGYIRERQLLEEVLHKNEEEQFKAMIRASLDGFWITDVRGCFLEVNDAYCQMMGYIREELLNMCITDVDAEDTPEGTARHIGKLLKTGSDRFETRHRRKDGRILNIEISANYSNLNGGQLYCFLRDITVRKQAEEKLRLDTQILNNISDTVFLLDLDGNFVYLNETAWKSRGYARDEMMGLSLHTLTAPEYNPLIAPRMDDILKKGYGFFESAHRRKDGSVMPVEINVRVIESGGKKLLLSVIRDITERKHSEEILRESEIRLKDMFDNLSSGVAVYQVSPDGHDFTFTAFNQAAERIEKMSSKNLIGKNALEVFPDLTESGLLDVLRRVWQSSVAERFPLSFCQDGLVSGWRDYYVYKLPNGEIVAIYDDVTHEKQAEERLYYLAHHDALTGLPNRMLFSDRIRQALAAAKRGKTHLALMFLDLDKFKPVNDELGHDIGDLLLKEVAKRMQNCVRESDTVSRIGGDEFVVLLPGVEAEQYAMQVAEKILYAIAQPYELTGNSIHISSSIGVAVYPGHGENEKLLVKNADIAMYHAKEGGRNQVMLYQPDMAG